MEFVKGLDTSHWSDDYRTIKTIDWSVAKKKNIEFMITKATESINYKDQTLRILFNGAKIANVLRGAYHFLSSRDDISEQAYFFWEYIKEDIGELPPTLDVEDFYPKTNPLARGAKLYNQIIEFMDIIEKKSGKVPILYTSPNIMKYYLGAEYCKKLIRYPLWIAQYLDYTYTHFDKVYYEPWDNWTIWQYSDREEATQYGFNESKTVDANVFNGGMKELYKICGMDETSQLPPSEKIYSDSDKLNLLWQAHVELH